MDIFDSSKKYLDMVDELDGHADTPERNKERTEVHNELIAKMVSQGLCPPNTLRSTVRWLARYILNDYTHPEESTRIMFARKGYNELVAVPPFFEFEENRVIDFYYPVIVTIKAWNGV